MLPALRLYLYEETRFSIGYMLAFEWLHSSLILFTLWYFFWRLWDFKEGNNKWYALVLFGTFLALVALYFKFFGIASIEAKVGLFPPTILFLIIQYTLKSQQRLSRLHLEKEQLQTENYKAQLKTLRTQVDPHFLFNSLNTLRSMVRQQHSGSEQFILSLSDFYRQTLQHNEQTTILLSKELAVLQSYLFLMKSRNEKAVQVEFKIDESLLKYQIPTMVLQTVVENCFKHNSMTSKKPLQITISSTEDRYICVCNNIQAKLKDEESSGLGLELIRKRYELMNVEQGFIFRQTPEEFCVKLKLIEP